MNKLQIAERTDFEIMLCRTLAKKRVSSITPADIQKTVILLEVDNLMIYERKQGDQNETS